MLLRGIVTSCKYLTFQYKITLTRTLSSKAGVLLKTNETVPKSKEKRFVKPETTRDLKAYDGSFVVNLFKGECDKKIFVYPSIFARSELESVIKHSIEVEDFLKRNPNIPVDTNTLKEFKKLELFGLSIPQQYGGAGYSVTETKFLIECCSINPNIGRFLGYCDDIGSRLISTYGTEEQKQKYLPRLASGESCITVAYLETGPLVDFSGFEGSVIIDHEKNGFLINAKKKWVHNAQAADLILVFAKSAILDEDENELSKYGFDFFITEKTTPGISVHQLKSGYSHDFDLFEVDFKNVFVPKENQLGNSSTLGYLKLQNVFTHRELTNAVICSSLIKRMIHSALSYCEDKIIENTSLKQFEHIQISMACLSAYAYALESLIYLITTKFDSYIEPNLFHEGILAKILAVEMLQLAIQRYIQILGHDSFKKNEILEQALKTLHYCSIFDESSTHLKLIVSSAGLMHCKPSMITLVKKLRKGYDYPLETLKYYLFAKPKKISQVDSKLGIKGELHESLAKTGDILEMCLGKLKMGVEDHLIKFGNTALEDEFALTKYADMAAYIYALAASLSRASTAFCYDMKNSEREIDIVRLLGHIFEAKFEQLATEVFHYSSLSNYYREVGKLSFNNKEYPAEHPLSRAY